MLTLCRREAVLSTKTLWWTATFDNTALCQKILSLAIKQCNALQNTQYWDKRQAYTLRYYLGAIYMYKSYARIFKSMANFPYGTCEWNSRHRGSGSQSYFFCLQSYLYTNALLILGLLTASSYDTLPI